MKDAACFATHCFCEGPYLDQAILQPMNTLSALAFIIPAYLVWKQRESWQTFYADLYAVALILLCFGTFFFHATLTEVGQWSDGMGLYAVITFVGLYFVTLSLILTKKIFLTIFLFLNLSAGFFSYNNMSYRLPLFGTFVGLTFLSILFLGFRKSVSYKKSDLLLSLGFFCTGLVFQVLDNKLVWCSKFSWWQGHALWHVLSAVATYYLFILMKNAKTWGVKN